MHLINLNNKGVLLVVTEILKYFSVMMSTHNFEKLQYYCYTSS